MAWTTIVGRVVSGHGVASGKARDPRFPEGTLCMQEPFFLERGFDLGQFHEGTLNVSISPRRYSIVQSAFTFREVKWSPDLPAEDFSFFNCRLAKDSDNQHVEGMIYYPHPETKPEFFQDPSTLEILAPFLGTASTGAMIDLQLPNAEIAIE